MQTLGKKVLVALPKAMLEEIDFIATDEHRTRSDLIREALRRYIDTWRRKQVAPLSVSTINENISITPPADATRHNYIG